MSLKRWYNQRVLQSAIEYIDAPLDFFVSMMKRNEHFSFSRYGDGEWAAIFKKEGKNCDGHVYFPEMGDQLLNCLTDPESSCLLGMQPLAMRKIGRELKSFLQEHQIDRTWYNSDVFHDANKKGKLYPLVAQMREMDVVMVGPAFLRQIEGKVFPLTHFIEIPEENCFLAKEQIMDEIVEYGTGKSGVVYAFSASMLANILIEELVRKLGPVNWYVDFGSVWDVYASVQSRGVYRKLDWAPLIEKNLHGK